MILNKRSNTDFIPFPRAYIGTSDFYVAAATYRILVIDLLKRLHTTANV